MRAKDFEWKAQAFWLFAVAGGFATYLGRWFFYQSVVRFGPAKASIFQISSALFTALVDPAIQGLAEMDDHGKQPRRDYATAAQAMQILGVRPQTLYAYVSRGWIRSIPQEGKKDKPYLRDDINRVVMRSLARSGHGAVAPACSRGGHAGERIDDRRRAGSHAAPRRR